MQFVNSCHWGFPLKILSSPSPHFCMSKQYQFNSQYTIIFQEPVSNTVVAPLRGHPWSPPHSHHSPLNLPLAPPHLPRHVYARVLPHLTRPRTPRAALESTLTCTERHRRAPTEVNTRSEQQHTHSGLPSGGVCAGRPILSPSPTH